MFHTALDRAQTYVSMLLGEHGTLDAVLAQNQWDDDVRRLSGRPAQLVAELRKTAARQARKDQLHKAP